LQQICFLNEFFQKGICDSVGGKEDSGGRLFLILRRRIMEFCRVTGSSLFVVEFLSCFCYHEPYYKVEKDRREGRITLKQDCIEP